MKKKSLLITIIAIFGLATITMAQVPSYVPTNGLVGWWSFTGNANDESGNGNNGIIVGATLSTDRDSTINSAYFFNGSSEIDCGTNSSLNINECTFSYWIFLSTTTPIYQTILSKYDVNKFGSYAASVYGNKAEVWFTKDSSTYVEVVSNDSLSINQWYHITATHSTTLGTKLYINGVLNNYDTTIFNVLQAPTDEFRIGSQGSFYPVEIKSGKIDDIGVWNRVLTQVEITDLFNSSSSVGINEFSQNNLFSIYPNPTTSQINVNADAKLLGSDYTVYDNTGKSVLTGIINSKKTIIELGNLSGGIYLFRVGKNLKQTFKVIKE